MPKLPPAGRVRAALAFTLLSTLVAPGPAVALEPGAAESAARTAKPDLDALEALAQRFFAERPRHFFETWDAERRRALLAEAAQVPLREGEFDAALQACFTALKKHAWKPKGNAFDTPFGKASFLTKGKGGRGKGLVIGMHGGGEGQGDAAEATRWSLKDCLGLYPQGIRLVHDTWNTVHGERFLLTLVEQAKVHHEVDPDRVYAMGFSMGGTGSWFLAGRHPDLLAGAAPCAGVLMAEPKSQVATKEEVKSIQHGLLPNVRNVPIYSFIGLADKNCMPGTFLFAWDRIQELRAADPGGWSEFHFQTYEDLAHAFPPGEPEGAFRWLAGKRREPYPKTIVWEYASDPFPQAVADDPLPRLEKRHFHWLHCSAPQDAMRVRATREGNAFTLDVKGADPRTFSIRLNPELVDVAEDVVVVVNGKERYRGKPEPDLRVLLDSLDAKTDRRLAFDREASWN